MTNTKSIIAAVCLLACTVSGFAAGKTSSIYHKGWIDFNKNGVKDVFEDPSKPVEDRVEDLLSQMTLEEKTGQLTTLYGTGRVLKDAQPTDNWKNEIWKDGIANIDEELNGVGSAYTNYYDLIYPFSNHVEAVNNIQRWFVEQTRLGIPVEFTNEGIHGLNHTLATPLPAPIAIGSTWDRDLVFRAGGIVGHEAKLLGYQSVYAPILDVCRDQRWGRVLECYGEEPFVVAELGLQMVNGIQQWGVTSCLKHYAAYGVPKGGRDGAARTDPHINPRELHEVFLYPFRRVVSEAHPMEVMSSYNDWNGEPVSSSHYFLTELLRDAYGFDGYVVSDSDAVEFIYDKHNVATSYEEGAKMVEEAGLNVRTNFQSPAAFIEPLRAAVRDGILSMDVVDQRVREVLSVKFRLGLFDNPYPGDGKAADKLVGPDNTMDFMLEMGREAIVLLKNDDNILPLDKSKLDKVLVTGPLAAETNFMTSRYGPNGLKPVTMLDGIRNYLGSDVEVLYEKGCNTVDARWPQSEIIPWPLQPEELEQMQKAIDLADDADVIIAVMGEDDNCTGESKSRSSLDLPGRQRDFLMKLQQTGKPIVLVLVNGQPLTINWEDAMLPAIVETWFPSCIGGTVLAETLFGDNNPSGKLTISFPKTIGQIEFNFPFKKGSHNNQHKRGPNGKGDTRVNDALYPFGHGLSYTTFEYSDMKVDSSDPAAIHVSMTLTNTGKMAGTEVVQLYIRDLFSSVVTYDSVLRGFQRVSLEPGESKQVEFTVYENDLAIIDKDMKWTAEPGEFEFRLGSSSEDIRLRTTIDYKSEK